MAAKVPAGAVVVGVDGSAKDHRAVAWASEEAMRRGVPLHVIHAFPLAMAAYSDYGMMPTEEMLTSAERVAAEAAERAAQAQPGLATSSEVVVEAPATALVEASREASVVVLGARGLGPLASRLRGSVSQKVAAYAHGPVVVVREHSGPPDGPVVVGFDIHESPTDVLRFAFEQARDRGLRLRVVHASPPQAFTEGFSDRRAQDMWERAAERRRERTRTAVAEVARDFPGVDLELVEVAEHPVDALVERSTDASLLVVGSRGRRGLVELRLGSVSRGVLHQVPTVAVVRVRPEGAERSRSTS